jgi:hypothetical protein
LLDFPKTIPEKAVHTYFSFDIMYPFFTEEYLKSKQGIDAFGVGRSVST